MGKADLIAAIVALATSLFGEWLRHRRRQRRRQREAADRIEAIKRQLEKRP